MVRQLGVALQAAGAQVVPVGWDSTGRTVKRLGETNLGFGHATAAAASAGRGHPPTWLLLPEMPSFVHDGVDPIDVGQAYGIKTAAIVHDLIPVKLPQLYDPALRASYARYYAALARADLVVTTTRYVANDFRAFLAADRLAAPAMALAPLGGDAIEPIRPGRRAPLAVDAPLLLLLLGTWEPRKNHLRVLQALRGAGQRSPRPIGLTIAGRRGHDPAYDQAVLAAAVGLPNVTFAHNVSDTDLAMLFARHQATIYPSYEEGFGLPVLESLWQGLPCLCHSGSSLAEIAPGGGTLLADMQDQGAITAALLQLAGPELLESLAEQAAARPVDTWQDCAQTLLAALTRR